jgi:flagellar biosynthesis protein FlhF
MKVTDIRTYRAKTVQEALAMVRRDLGPQASVLQTRQVRGGGLLRWLAGDRIVEVTASAGVSVPSRLPGRVPRAPESTRPVSADALLPMTTTLPAREPGMSVGLDLLDLVNQMPSVLDAGRLRAACRPGDDGDEFFRLFADLIEAEVSEDLARQWIDRLRQQCPDRQTRSVGQLKSDLAALIEAELPVSGPIRITGGRRHLVALVGPTGVGKTTTVAKLAANFRLRERQRVGLITVDTYRIAAVEQLRTYADIIDLPMEIVSTPREMHQAVARMSDLDLILMDTAGRSPRDEVQLQELKSMLVEAEPDEVHLVLSSVASGRCLSKMAEQFAAVGTTALLLTKLDEAASLGNLLPLVRACRLPLSYFTFGQDVPDDITPGHAGQLARVILGLERLGSRRPVL